MAIRQQRVACPRSHRPTLLQGRTARCYCRGGLSPLSRLFLHARNNVTDRLRNIARLPHYPFLPYPRRRHIALAYLTPYIYIFPRRYHSIMISRYYAIVAFPYFPKRSFTASTRSACAGCSRSNASAFSCRQAARFNRSVCPFNDATSGGRADGSELGLCARVISSDFRRVRLAKLGAFVIDVFFLRSLL
jgi:hypothetical protein